MIHGFAGTPAEMRGLAGKLDLQGWHTQGILLPGFGQEITRLADYGKADWLAAARRAWQTLREFHRPAILVGYSMGGAIALHLAAELPPDGLILIAPFWKAPGWVLASISTVNIFNPHPRIFKNANFNNPRIRLLFNQAISGIDLDDPSVQDFIRQEVTLPLSAVIDLLKLGRQAYHRAGEISSPVLVLQGRQDKVVHSGDTFRLVRKFPPGLVIYRELNGAHDFLRTHSPGFEELSNVIIHFLARLPDYSGATSSEASIKATK